MRRNPHLIEINAYFLLSRHTAQGSRNTVLNDIPESYWLEMKARGFDIIWLMGVWSRSPAARRAAETDRRLVRECRDIMNGQTRLDFAGSPYAVWKYEIDPRLGTAADLLALKRNLNGLGLSLILDFVPNHLAVDHAWAGDSPGRFIHAPLTLPVNAEDSWFFDSGSHRLAHGRDPYFAPWSDTVQLNIFDDDARKGMIGELLKIAEVSDGVRCDMAMLVLNDVFRDTWNGYLDSHKSPEREFWSEAIAAVKERHPQFTFMAEVYWDMEKRLQELGFDYTYDKVLYDRLLRSGTPSVREHINSKAAIRPKLVGFIENHDEVRAMTAFGKAKSLAAAAVTSTLPGMRFFHDGQMDGKKIHTPIQLEKEALEASDEDVSDYYDKLLEYVHDSVLHEGEWRLLRVQPAWEKNEGHGNILAWLWRHGTDWRLVTVNYSADHCQGVIPLPENAFGSQSRVNFQDILSGENYERDVHELYDPGLYVSLNPWSTHLFKQV
jgi:hypothetical protein